jgi:hypothetical protein
MQIFESAQAPLFIISILFEVYIKSFKYLTPPNFKIKSLL